MDDFKSFLKRIPILGSILKEIAKFLRKFRIFPGSKTYWEELYSNNGNSGSGSYGRLATFKARVINKFVQEEKIESVIEFGCGDGHQLSLAEYPKYVGIDVSPTAIEMCKRKFGKDKSKSFYLYHPELFINNSDKFKAELSISLDVIFHLIEDDVFEEYMSNLFKYSKQFVIVYSSNFAEAQNYHERHRKFTDWVERNQKNWRMVKKIDNVYPFDENDPDNTSVSDFYIYKN